MAAGYTVSETAIRTDKADESVMCARIAAVRKPRLIHLLLGRLIFWSRSRTVLSQLVVAEYRIESDGDDECRKAMDPVNEFKGQKKDNRGGDDEEQ